MAAKNTGKRIAGVGLYGLLFLGTLAVLHHIPLTVDDLFFQNTSFSSAGEAFQYLLHFGNGRFLGNAGIIFLMHHLLLSDILRALVIAGLAVLLPKALKLEGAVYPLLTMFLLLCVSPGVFGEVYSWMSGFQNYIPPLLLFLCSVILLHGKKESKFPEILRCGVLLLCGICMQLYVEHSSCLNCLFVALMALSCFRKKREYLLRSLILFLGTVIGLALVLSTTLLLPETVLGNKASYFSRGFGTLILGVVRNTVDLLGMFTENAAALVTLASLLLSSAYRVRARLSSKQKAVMLSGLLIPCLFFVNSLVSGLSPWYGKLALSESGLLVVTFLWYFAAAVYSFHLLYRLSGTEELRQACLMFAAAGVCFLPVLFVWPVGYRCLFHAYVLLLGSVLLLAKAFIRELSSEAAKKLVMTAAASMLVIAFLSLTAVFSDIRRMVAIRDEYLEEVSRSGADTAAYFLIPSPYIHDYWDDNFEHALIMNGKTLKLKITPADLWFQRYYYPYS